MFTGLVEELGKIVRVKPDAGGLTLAIKTTQSFMKELSVGASVAVNGACQTVEYVDGSYFQVFSVPETLKASNFSFLTNGDPVNLELPLRPSDRLGGHIVQGHIDTTAEVKEILKQSKSWDISIAYQHSGILEKGSITLDGVSLTVQKSTESNFSVQIIPETLKKTNIASWKEGRKVNIEIDYLVKAVQSYAKNIF